MLRHRDIPNIRDIDVYTRHGGYETLRKALTGMSPLQVTDVVKASGLRGRGGAAFPTGVKWSFCPEHVRPTYVVVNADESEPGTFKDREIIEKNAHQLIEGIALCAYAIGSQTAFIYGRGEFKGPFSSLQQSIDEAYQQGWLGQNILGTDFSLDVYTHLGAGAYICGEETALLDSLEGKVGMPRSRPPFPATAGLYGQPTVVNNVETLANVPPIVLYGADWYRQFGTDKSPGTKIFCLSGHVVKPGNYELPLGTPLRTLLEECGGGVLGGRAVKALLPAGVSAPMLPGYHLDPRPDYESVPPARAILGSAPFIGLDAAVDMGGAGSQMIPF
ncbi:MAG: SLBB domain-containing protein, partial [Ardenticatenia bacterium]|nr:SLBB domain-containing protein [Ardenticatenia bacterium]